MMDNIINVDKEIKNMIAILSLVYGIAISLWFLFIDRNESEGLKKKITAMFLMLNSVLLIIFAVIGLLKIIELSNFEGTLILLGIAMIQLSLLNKNKVKPIYIYFGLATLINDIAKNEITNRAHF